MKTSIEIGGNDVTGTELGLTKTDQTRINVMLMALIQREDGYVHVDSDEIRTLDGKALELRASPDGLEARVVSGDLPEN